MKNDIFRSIIQSEESVYLRMLIMIKNYYLVKNKISYANTAKYKGNHMIPCLVISVVVNYYN